VDSCGERGNDASTAQDSTPPVRGSEDPARCGTDESGDATESGTAKSERTETRDGGRSADRPDADPPDDGRETSDSESDQQPDTPIEPTDAGMVGFTAVESTVAIDLPSLSAGSSASPMPVEGDGAAEVGPQWAAGGALITEPSDRDADGSGASEASGSATNPRSTGTPLVEASSDRAGVGTDSVAPSVSSASSDPPAASPSPAASAGTASASGESRTATPLPEGFSPVATASSAAPDTTIQRTVESASVAVGASATAGARTRPEPTGDGRRTEARTPAAVSRAEEVNRTIAAGRGGESTIRSDAVVAEVVTPVRSADLSNRLSRPTAQTLPMPGAETAPQTLDEGATRTTPGVARGLDALARQKGGSLVMRLDPPSLGQLRLEMQMQGGRVAVLMTAASETARSLLHDNLGSLRQALEDRGLAVDRLAVETAGRTGESSSNSRSENRGDGQDARGGQDASDRQDAGEGRSRGRRDDASRRHAGRGDGSGRPEAVEFGEVLAGAGVSAT
jgi:flagellar hook-length control protein FliK